MEKNVVGNVIIYQDKKFNFTEWFNPETGFLVRSDVHGLKDCNPIQRSFPELLDIGIMGHCHISHLNICKKAGIDCYQMAFEKNQANMSFEDYSLLINQCKNKVFQVALGGAGDPNKHEDFEKLLQATRKAGIVPNLTTSGIFLTDKEIDIMKKYCGAVAISFYSRLKRDKDNTYSETNPDTLLAIQRLLEAKCLVNIHYVISKDTIDEAITRLNFGLFPKGINAVIFILYKPVGMGKQEKTLTLKNNSFRNFLKLVQENNFEFKIGFDTCCTPAILKECNLISEKSLDFCEAARFSMYIDNNLNAYPCSFDCEKQDYRESLKDKTIEEVWNSNLFNKFKNKQENFCFHCNNKTLCLGGCALDFNLDICGEKFLNS